MYRAYGVYYEYTALCLSIVEIAEVRPGVRGECVIKVSSEKAVSLAVLGGAA